MFLTGPQRGPRGRRRGGQPPSSLGGHEVHERNGVCDLVAGDDRCGRAGSPGACSAYLPQHAGEEAAAGSPSADPELPDPGRQVPALPPQRLRRAHVIDGIVDAGSLLEIGPRWARSILTGLARCEGPSGRRDREPAALPRRGARRRVRPEGRPLRRDLQRLRPAPGRARRHARLHARLPAGAGGSDPLRRRPACAPSPRPRCRG